MELSERYMQKFENEGFSSVYEWQDPPGTVHPTHAHQGKVSLFVTDGSITFTIAGEQKTITAPARFDIPPGVPHSAVVGTDGWIAVVGEEIPGDS